MTEWMSGSYRRRADTGRTEGKKKGRSSFLTGSMLFNGQWADVACVNHWLSCDTHTNSYTLTLSHTIERQMKFLATDVHECIVLHTLFDVVYVNVSKYSHTGLVHKTACFNCFVMPWKHLCSTTSHFIRYFYLVFTVSVHFIWWTYHVSAVFNSQLQAVVHFFICIIC